VLVGAPSVVRRVFRPLTMPRTLANKGAQPSSEGLFDGAFGGLPSRQRRSAHEVVVRDARPITSSLRCLHSSTWAVHPSAGSPASGLTDHPAPVVVPARSLAPRRAASTLPAAFVGPNHNPAPMTAGASVWSASDNKSGYSKGNRLPEDRPVGFFVASLHVLAASTHLLSLEALRLAAVRRRRHLRHCVDRALLSGQMVPSIALGSLRPSLLMLPLLRPFALILSAFLCLLSVTTPAAAPPRNSNTADERPALAAVPAVATAAPAAPDGLERSARVPPAEQPHRHQQLPKCPESPPDVVRHFSGAQLATAASTAYAQVLVGRIQGGGEWRFVRRSWPHTWPFHCVFPAISCAVPAISAIAVTCMRLCRFTCCFTAAQACRAWCPVASAARHRQS